MRAYQAAKGDVLWFDAKYAGPAMIHHDSILMAGNACDLLTGKLKMREHPLTGELVEWKWSRNYGCNTPMASENLMTFRSGAAGYLDYCNDGGTGNFGGFRSSCTNNLVVAGGVLCAPDYTRTCTCNYQNQTSLALVYMPEAEMWTSFGDQAFKQAVKNVGVNLGAPGDRKADDGTLWVEYPSVAGGSPPVQVEIEPKDVTNFRRHSSQVSGSGLAWVASSGAEGLTSLKLNLGGAAERTYTVRLTFMEPENVAPGERVFDVSVQGNPVLKDLDIVKETGAPLRSLVKEFAGVKCGDSLLIQLAPHSNNRGAVLSGVEVREEEKK
jgi:hypothetical protein